MEEIGIRIKQFMEDKNLSPTEFAEQVGIQRSSLSHLFSGRNKPSIDLLLKVKKQFPDADLEWLICGKSFIPTESLSRESSKLDKKALKKDVTDVNNPLLDIDNQHIDSESKNLNSDPLKNRSIERVIIFYKDGHFKEYSS